MLSFHHRAYMKSWEKARYQGRKSEDADVTKERLRVESNNDPVTSKRDEEKREDVVMIKHLTKFYNWKKVIFYNYNLAISFNISTYT